MKIPVYKPLSKYLPITDDSASHFREQIISNCFQLLYFYTKPPFFKGLLPYQAKIELLFF